MAAAPHDLDAILSLDPATIDEDIDGRIGLYFPSKAEAYAGLINAHGQNDPIKVRRAPKLSKFEWVLVAGLHRLRACTIIGSKVRAIEVVGDDAAIRLIQASENHDRRDLGPIERAMFVHAVAEAAKTRLLAAHQGKSQIEVARERKAAKVQFSDLEKADDRAAVCVDTFVQSYSWKAETAEALGLGPKDVQRAIRIFDCVVAPNRDLMEAFKDHPVAQTNSRLLEIAAIRDAAKRRQVIETLINGPKDLGLTLQMVGLKPAPVTAETAATYLKFTSQITSGFARLGTAEKRRFIPEFVAQMPKGMRDLLREELNREQGQ